MLNLLWSPFVLFFCVNNILLNIISNSPLSIGTNTLYSQRKLWKSYTISLFIGTYISFIHLIKSSFIQYYSIVSLYSLSLQCAIRCNRNPFRSYYLAFIKSIMALSYVFGLILFLYFLGQVNAIIVVDSIEVELMGCYTSKAGRILVLQNLVGLLSKGRQFKMQLTRFGR